MGHKQKEREGEGCERDEIMLATGIRLLRPFKATWHVAFLGKEKTDTSKRPCDDAVVEAAGRRAVRESIEE